MMVECMIHPLVVVRGGSGSGGRGGRGNKTVAGNSQMVLVLGELGLGAAEVHLELAELVLEERDYSDAAVDGVTDAHVGLVGEGVNGVFALVGVEFVEEFGDVAGAEDFVDVGEFLGLVWGEVGGKNALWLAFAAEEFACCAGGV